ncbi:DUF2752 domain-containing protein [Luteolibacter marinus]|uniref:DUF2752 domain-containing protein n=1 Tax=Luteolibacter marinus TaxID=2776705 RepID=UPI001868713E|nr:DUF2752 domain-containing protein [Luteolibacter marinus]
MTRIRRPWTWLALVGAVGFIVLRFAWPAWPSVMPACTFHEMTGLHCPGCGGTRCAICLLDGDLAGAFAMNAAVTLIALALAVVLGRAVWREWRGGRLVVFPAKLAWFLAGFVIAFGLLRNLPWWPLTLLAPH